MVRVAVELPTEFASTGEFLADAQAYDAAGAAAIWLSPPGLEPLTLLAAVAVVTTRAGLGASVALGAPWPVGLAADVATALRRLSRDRLLLCVQADAGLTEELVRTLRGDGGRQRILIAQAQASATAAVAVGGEAALRCAALLGDGLVSAAATAEDAAADFQRARELRRDLGVADDAADPFELWARVPAPQGRSVWRELLEAYETIGATGVIVAHAPNLLDILRNPEEDDRQDLAIAVG
ncbi:MAG TPA: hypothetical protein VGO86_05770 [Candidatus Dormibacteraeota bacterium]|jgi:hypothetical protein